MVKYILSAIYVFGPILLLRMFCPDNYFITGIHAHISELGISLLLLNKAFKERKFFNAENSLAFAHIRWLPVFITMLVGEIIYTYTLSVPNRGAQTIIKIDALLYAIFMSIMALNIFFDYKKYLRDRASIGSIIVVSLFLSIVNFKFILVPLFQSVEFQTFDHYFTEISYALSEVSIIAMLLPLVFRVNKIEKYLFLQMLILMVVSDLAIRYQTSLFEQTGMLMGFEHGWQISIAVIFLLSLKYDDLFNTDNLQVTTYHSIRTGLSLFVCIGGILLMLLMAYLKLFQLKDVFCLTNLLLILYFICFLSNLLAILISSRIDLISRILESMDTNVGKDIVNFAPPVKTLTGVSEVDKILRRYNILVEHTNHIINKHLEQSKKVALVEISCQVAHDIRSPLSALNMMVKLNLQELPEEKRIIIRQQIERIQDIANNLLAKNRGSTASTNDVKAVRVELLSSIIEEIVTEKRLNFRSRLGLTIEGDVYDSTSYGLFAKFNFIEFKRIISNLINNSAEALKEGHGKIAVRLTSPNSKTVSVVVEDNGKGIPPEVLAKLGQKHISYGKENSSESGNGLGLNHAYTNVHFWGGELSVESEVGKGTKIILSLPRVTPPKWFVPSIELEPGQAVVILDDDQGIHQTWDNRFKDLSFENNNITVVHLSNPGTFREWVKAHNVIYQKILFLSDFELLGYTITGLDLLEEQNIKDAILVTSHYENHKIRERCDRLGVRLIPKMLAGFVPINVLLNVDCLSVLPQLEVPSVNSSSNTDIYEYVYIDDDKWLRMGWEMAAKKKNINLLTLSTTNDFEKHKDKISKEKTVIYLDRNLGENELKGDEFAKILHVDGYQNLNLATGEDADLFTNLSWLKVYGKECPFEENDW
ncbi:MAG: HAMP domain-containing histidine kinase [Oligoflexia bacterium]|nr:HAMP domain-containing histidine kinase [Oligoflexia bacterium]